MTAPLGEPQKVKKREKRRKNRIVRTKDYKKKGGKNELQNHDALQAGWNPDELDADHCPPKGLVTEKTREGVA